MQELLIQHDLNINSNMEELAISIKEDIAQKYDVIVTEDTVADTKKIMAEINKQKDTFKKTYKAFKEQAFEPFKPLDLKAKEIEGYYDEARTVLDSQVKKFEASKLERAKEVCTAYLLEQCNKKDISANIVNIQDLFMKLGSVTSAGSISATAKADINTRVQAVENAILKAKLEAEEKAKRDREIADRARLEAEEKAKQREAELIIRAEREKLEAVERATREALSQTPKESQATEEAAQDSHKKGIYLVSFEFEIASKSDEKDAVLEKVKQMMLSENGLKYLASCQIKKG